MSENEIADQNFDPRHRIVGAIIVVSLIVILVPLILDKNEWEPRQPGKQSEIPSSTVETRVVVTRVEDMRRKNEPQDTDKQEPTLPPVDDKVKPAEQKKTVKASPVSEPVIEKKLAGKTADTEKPVARDSRQKKPGTVPVAKEGWVVQLGTFANSKNVDRMRTQLTSKGYKVTTETVNLSSGPATRVRVGPFGRKTQAETMRKRIEADLGLKGSVLAAK